MAISIPQSVAYDIRQPILGDSFGWEGLEPAAAKKSIVIHGTGSEAPLEDGFTMANYHVNHNGWGGIGVHFVVTEDGYPGKQQFGLPAGAHAQYVGDLLTWRAGTLGQNNGRIHIEISGLLENHPPTANQLRVTRAIIDFLIAPNNVLPSLNYYSQVTYHNAVIGQNTGCPGWRHPSFNQWFSYLQGGSFPDTLYASPATQPNPVLPDPPLPTSEPIQSPLAPEPGKGGDVPEYEKTWRVQTSKAPIRREGATAIDVTTGHVVATIPVEQVIDIAGYFDYQGHVYARTVYSQTHDKWNGIDASYFEAPTGQVTADIPIAHPNVATPAPDPIVLPDEVQHATDQQLKDAVVPETSKLTWRQFLWEVFAQALAKIVKRIKP